MLSLFVVPVEKTDFIDHITGGQVDLSVVTETFLTEQNNVTQAALLPSGYAFKDQPRSNGDARGGTGIFHHDSFLSMQTVSWEKKVLLNIQNDMFHGTTTV